MPNIEQVCRFLQELAPLDLAEDWDNVGLLVGDPALAAHRVMTCLTITPASAAEAIAEGAQLIVTHHPLPFGSLKRITTESHAGRLLWSLMNAGVAVYSSHTAFDSAVNGINAALAQRLGLQGLRPLVPREDLGTLGAGRWGALTEPLPLAEFADQAKRAVGLSTLQIVGADDQPLRQVAVGCGSGGSFLEAAQAAGCDALVTGEARFHTCLEAEAAGLALVLLGHYASERFALESLAEQLQARFVDTQVWASREESDPVRWR